MPNIPPLGPGPSGPVDRLGLAPGAARTARPAENRTDRRADRVEISEEARLLERLQNQTEGRTDRIERIQAEIAAGTYESEERLSAAIERFIAELDNESLI